MDAQRKAAISRRLRELRGDTRPEAVAAAIGVSVVTLYNYERESGGFLPRPQTRRAIANYYGVEEKSIFGD